MTARCVSRFPAAAEVAAGRKGAAPAARAAAAARSAIAVLLLIAVGTLALALVPSAARAHRAPGTTSVIDWNPRSGHTEVEHRLHVHDALTGIPALIGSDRLDPTMLADLARIALYVEQRFAVQMNDDPVPLITLGAELLDDYVLIYQEWRGRLPPDARVSVRSDILRDAFPGQINVVYWRSGPTVRSRTLRFRDDDGWRTFAAREPTPAGNDVSGASDPTDDPGEQDDKHEPRTEGPPEPARGRRRG